MREQELIDLYPRLFHMAEDGSWPAIQKYGLLSTSAILDLMQIVGNDRTAYESVHRPRLVTLKRRGKLDIVLRDQKPMSDGALLKCLRDGLTPREWYEILNHKTFFWLSRERLWRLLRARAYRDKPQIVLTLQTAALVNDHRDEILLSPINSGSTIMKPQPRGRDTFMSITDYPYAERRRNRKKEDALVELVVPYAVPKITDYVIAVHRVYQEQLVEIWRKPGTNPGDGPQL